VPHRSRFLTAVLASIALFALTLPVRADRHHSAGGESSAPPEPEGFTYTVRAGDTLSDIAVRFDVSVDALVSQNPGLDPDRIRRGQTIRIVNGLRRVVHTVERGQSLSLIAARYEVAIDALLRWNPGLGRDRVRAGRELVVYTSVPESRSQSIGAPAHGELAFARQLPRRHPAFYVRTPSRAFGTDETVRAIIEGLESVRAADPAAPRVEIHDLSFESGGPIRGHHSHESGRDADIAYYQVGCRDVCRIHRIRPEQLDVARLWALFSHWIERGDVEAIFMDHALQGALYEHARSLGVSRHELSRIFQYPRPIEDRYGLIRHEPHHADHFHVRFACHESDPDCR
jgi:LysM repeat protein